MTQQRRRTPRALTLGMVFSLIIAACGGSDETDVEPAATDLPDTDNAVIAESADGTATQDDSNNGGPVVAPAETGPLTEYDLGGLTFGYDANYWRVDDSFGVNDPDDALIWLMSDASNAVIQLGFTNKALDPTTDPCASDYSGGYDPTRHSVALLHQETLSNNGVFRIHDQDLDWRGDDLVRGISYGQLTFNPDDANAVGDDYCRFLHWIEVSPRTRDDGSPVYYRIEVFWAFSLDFVYAPFKEQFDSADELRQRDGFAEMLAVLETIEVPGVPA